MIFRIMKYLLTRIFSENIVHENPIMSMYWVDIDKSVAIWIAMFTFVICFCIQLTAVIIPQLF
jgi:hypothetical protein